jgi:hypothetical protein
VECQQSGAANRNTVWPCAAASAAGATTAQPNPCVVQVGVNEDYECAGRGICDRSSGICKCFSGYFGVACDQQNALV